MNLSYYQFIDKVRPVELALLLKKISGIKRRYYAFDNIRLYVDPASNFGVRVIRDKYYEPEITHAIEQTLAPGDTFIDLGGNEGYFTVRAARKVGPEGKVFCIEPQERLWPVILNNVFINNLFNVQLLPVAVGKDNSEGEITLAPSLNTGSTSATNSGRSMFWKKQKVKFMPLDQIIEVYKITSIKLIKIDIEGYELFALKSAVNTLKKKIVKNIMIEVHPEPLRTLGQTPEEVFQFMSDLGYKRSLLNEQFNEYLFTL